MSVILSPTPVGPASWDYSRAYVFGVINVTPDSFSDGGIFFDTDAAVEQGRRLVAAGADALDVGGESTRPGAPVVSVDEEVARVIPVIERLAPDTGVPISIDTYKAETARRAVEAGATIINDISGGALDGAMLEAVAETGALYIAGHLRGDPASMQDGISFSDVVADVISELRDRIRHLVKAGVRPERIWVDPGIGFGKTAEQSMALIDAAGQIRDELGYPVMIGCSRKSFIGAVTGQPADERLLGTCASAAVAVVRGADALRLHDVEELVPALRVVQAIVRQRRSR